MSVREEDRQKNTCPSRGLGIAAAAIGVGVGAALYYFFNKRQENSDSEGASSDWNCERDQTFNATESDDSYTTISEHETSDTSVNNSSMTSNMSWSHEDSIISIDSSSDDESDSEDSSESDSDSDFSNEIHITDTTVETGYLSLPNGMSNGVMSDSEVTDWDITTSSLGVPEQRSRSPLLMLIRRIGNRISPKKKKAEREQMTEIREQAFRERSWTLEECSICFDVMLRNQEVMTLPCTHNFHAECIMPWLQEKQTCPNCRKVAE